MTSREDLLRLRNELSQRELGKVLLNFLQDYVTEQAVKNLDAIEIKGMCRLIQQVKNIPEMVDNK
jgi:ferritin